MSGMGPNMSPIGGMSPLSGSNRSIGSPMTSNPLGSPMNPMSNSPIHGCGMNGPMGPPSMHSPLGKFNIHLNESSLFFNIIFL